MEKYVKYYHKSRAQRRASLKEIISFSCNRFEEKKSLSSSNDKLFYTIYTFTRSPRIARLATDSDEEEAATAQVGEDINIEEEEDDEDVVIDEIEDLNLIEEDVSIPQRLRD